MIVNRLNGCETREPEAEAQSHAQAVGPPPWAQAKTQPNPTRPVALCESTGACQHFQELHVRSIGFRCQSPGCDPCSFHVPRLPSPVLPGIGRMIKSVVPERV